MPMGDYPDFAACVADQKSKGHSDESARKICGAIKKRTEGNSLSCHKCGSPVTLLAFSDVYDQFTCLTCWKGREIFGIVDRLKDIIKGLVGVPKVVFTRETRTQGAKVCDICDPLDGKEYYVNDHTMPRIPQDTHPNCKCYYRYKDDDSKAPVGRYG